MVNLELLNGKIYTSGIKKHELADQLGFSMTTLRRKLQGEIEFKISEVVILCKVLKLTNSEREAIFFNA